MTHATISPHTTILCIVDFAYDESTIATVKALAGTSFDGHNWIVPILHLPILKLIFSTLTVAPEVISAYHALLKRMLTDLDGSQHRKGKLGQHIAELMDLHAVGIAAVRKTGWQPTLRPRAIVALAPVPTKPPIHDDDRSLGVLLSGIKNAHATAEKQPHIVNAVKRKRKKAA